MASFDFNELPPVLGKLVSELTLVHYRGEQCLDEVFDWAWDNYQFDCKALKESVKSEDRANMLRLLGNQCYKAKNYAEALDSYNQSIMAAPHPVLSNVRIEETEGDAEFGFPHIDPARYGGVALEKCSTLGKGFANRSAVMLDIGEYEKCLEDIDLALEYGYPEELRPKLEARRLKCQEAQRREKVSDCSQKDSVHNLKRFVLREIVKNMNTNATLKPPVMKDPNPCIPAFSSAVRVSYWPSKGRGLVATRDIKAGEVLGVERSFAIDIRQDFLRTFCSTCAFLCVNPLPCPGCSKVVFCSKPCRVKGLSEDHWLECKILSSVLVHGLDAMACSYKLLKTWNFRQMKSMYNKLKRKPTHPEHLGFGESGKYSSSSFQSVYHLRQGLENFPRENVIALCMNVFRMAKLLELSKRFFVDESGNPVPVTKEDFLDTCKILANNCAKFIENSFGTEEQVVTELYLGKSLINHSCSPVMASKSLGRVSFTYAVRPVAAGEELTISYVADFSSQPKLQRRGALVSDRSFLCSCQACEENWPTLPHLPEIRWSCVNCKKRVSNAGMHCHECLKRLGGKLDIKTDFEMRIIFEKVMSALGVLQRMQSKILQGEPISKQDFRHLCGAAEVAFEYSAMPSKALVGFMKIMDICGENGLV
ncbi:SET and MYND domain-containing protein 4-like isoform X1 [Macrobrachium rosenbergii]|uniref:SET and MYND domain-containing protein 4-like isoform X1 n=1 Tax=Macrobrachium rosenbergii TaxID=79674 RepID=UPI0034D62B07